MLTIASTIHATRAGRSRSTASRRPSSGPAYATAAGRGGRVLSANALVSMSVPVGLWRLSLPPKLSGAPAPNRATRATIALPESDRPDGREPAMPLPRTRSSAPANADDSYPRGAVVCTAAAGRLLPPRSGHAGRASGLRSRFRYPTKGPLRRFCAVDSDSRARPARVPHARRRRPATLAVVR